MGVSSHTPHNGGCGDYILELFFHSYMFPKIIYDRQATQEQSLDGWPGGVPKDQMLKFTYINLHFLTAQYFKNLFVVS